MAAVASSVRLFVCVFLVLSGSCSSEDSDEAELIEAMEELSNYVTDIADEVASTLIKFIKLKMNFKPLKGLLECDYGWHKAVAVKGMPTCYFFSEFETTWAESKDICNSMHADLATVRDTFEFSAIQDVVTGHEAWVGLRDKGGDALRWVTDNTVLTGDRDYWWASGEPNNEGERCVHFDKNEHYRWMDGDCNKEIRFVCQKPAVMNVREVS